MPTKKVAKKKAVKKPAAKRVAAKKPRAKAKKKSAPKSRRASVKKAAPKVHGKTVTHHRVVMIATCSNCNHIPDRIGSLLGTLAVLVAVLSTIVMSQANVPQNWPDLVGNDMNVQVEHQVAQR